MRAFPPLRRASTCATLALVFACLAAPARAQDNPPPASAPATAVREPVRVVQDESGARLQVGGRDFMIKGMNWDYIPIGENWSFDLWQQPENVIVAALDREMGLLAGMGANAIRVNVGTPPRWIRYIHDRYGIWSIVNHPVARYGFTIDGVWHPSVDYSNARMRAAIQADAAAAFAPYKGVPGVLMYLLGNENNYGLSWSSFEIEALPKGERDAARARYLYSLFAEIARASKAADPDVPVAIANGDLQYIDVIAQECKGAIDVFGSNVYRGISSGDLFARVKEKLGVPFMYTEFGCDAFNARTMREDQPMQARYLIGQWREIYEQSAGHGRAGNAIGGCVFQWSDGWWKYRQTERLDVHDTNASWPDGGYVEDFAQGENNMNEEWWGICAKGPPDERWMFELYPRAAYYALRRVFALDPYAAGAGDDAIRAHFAGIQPAAAALEARGDQASLLSGITDRVRVRSIRLQFETISTGGELVTTPDDPPPPGASLPAYRGFDHMQSFYTDFEAHPAPTVNAFLSVNILGHVARNPIDEIFYEKRGIAHTVPIDGRPQETSALERVKVYRAAMSWDARWFTLDGYYRTGHYHWGYEGDFFGLYREANYGPNIDTYNADAPLGAELAGKRALAGLKVAWGPQMWWGANPAVMIKYRRHLLGLDATAMYQNELDRQTQFATSSAITLPPTRKAAFALARPFGRFTAEAGGLWSGENHVGEEYQVAARTGGTWAVRRDVIRDEDTFGGKLRLTMSAGRLLWYGQAASMGVVAEAGPTQVQNYTGWYLKDTGSGNQRNVITGLVYNQGPWQLGPNFLWQKPLVGPMPADVPSPGRLRNILEDPFAVRSNREMTGAEFVLCYDPTPGTWLWQWDNDLREEARFAGSLGFVYRHMPTTMDASVGILADGITPFAFERSTPARDLWELQARTVSRVSPTVRVVAHAFAGTGEPNGDDPRRIERYGADVRMVARSLMVGAWARFNDWGPYDYHRDFNLTFPVQLMGEVSHSVGVPQWWDTNPQTRIGVRALWRSLDPNSPRYTGLPGDPNGSEWEIRTYLRLAL